MATFQSLPGFREFYPEDFARRNHIFRLWRQTASTFGFAEYDAPVLEPLELYKAKSGEEIEAQLFSFTDKGGREVALRPEMTPTVCRLVGAKASALKRPIKWFSIAEFYRYERMQKGRGRCFSQFNADIFGEPGPEAETELIAMLVQCLAAFGLTEQDFYVRLSDRNLWFYYLEALGLDEPRIRGVLGAVDRFEKYGEEAFKGYTEQFGPLDDGVKIKVLAFLTIKSLAALEHTLGSIGGEKLTARLADWKKLLGNLEAMGLARFVLRGFRSQGGVARTCGWRALRRSGAKTRRAGAAGSGLRDRRHDVCAAPRTTRLDADVGAGA